MAIFIEILWLIIAIACGLFSIKIFLFDDWVMGMKVLGLGVVAILFYFWRRTLRRNKDSK